MEHVQVCDTLTVLCIHKHTSDKSFQEVHFLSCSVEREEGRERRADRGGEFKGVLDKLASFECQMGLLGSCV